MEETVQLKSECGWPSLFLLFQNGLLMEHVLIFILLPPLALVVCFAVNREERTGPFRMPSKPPGVSR